MTAILTLQDLGPDCTGYQVVMRHRTKEIAHQHLDHGFHSGWGTMADQLETYAQGLK